MDKVCSRALNLEVPLIKSMNSLMQKVRLAPLLMQQWRSRTSLMEHFQARPQFLGCNALRSVAPLRYMATKAPYPPKTFHLKAQKGRCEGMVSESSLHYGKYGLKVIMSGKISYQTLEAARRVLSRKTKGHARMWIRVWATIPITKKPLEVRMGKGKGSVCGYVARVKAGQMLYEIDGLNPAAAKLALTQAGHKIGLRTKVVEWT